MRRPPAVERPPSSRLLVLVHAAVLIGIALGIWPATSAFFDTANREPVALERLRQASDGEPQAPPRGEVGSVVVLLLDGLRADEARRMTALRKLSRRAARAQVELTQPTLSRPFYHLLLTGVPQAGTGVRTNRFDGRARLDSLAERVRSAGGRFAVVDQGVPWLWKMHGRDGELLHSGSRGFGRAVDEALQPLHVARPTLLVVHYLEVDKTAHAYGVRAQPHLEALDGADRLVARVADRTASWGLPLAVLSDHGHIEAGGHGGNEPEVRQVPFILRAEGVQTGDRGALHPASLAPLLARVMGVPPPRSAVASVPSGWFEVPRQAGAGETARARRAIVEEATRQERARLRGRRLWLVPAALVLLLGILVVTGRAFDGFDVGSVAAPALWAMLIATIHRFVWERPFTLSAIDDVDRHGVRLALLGGVCAVIAATAAAFVPWLLARRTEPASSPVRRLRRAASATGAVAVAALVLVYAWSGGAAGPWPLGPREYYLPVLAPGCGAGACLAAGAMLLLSAPFRAELTAPTSDPTTTTAEARR